MDICLCASRECPRYNECYRGEGYYHATGIYTTSFLAQVCNESNGYEAFIEVEKRND